ncbi:MAG: hypothetical protein JWO24_549 [Rhodospirillales bacterium]|nr:hypothetical protein [Rhodospirillales bacterium]
MNALSILLGAALLGWPAFLNGYPLVFIDTVSYLEHTILWALPWDKAPAYGPFLHAFHWRATLWLALAAQLALVSWMLWLTQRAALGTARALVHLVLCMVLAALTALPWFAATLMPDVLAGVAALAIFLLGFGAHRLTRIERVAVTFVGVFAVAAHLSHLVIALAVVALVVLLRRRLAPVLRAVSVPALAILVLLGVNLADSGRATLSQNGAIFLLARLQADGPAVETLRARCPAAGWYLCGFIDRLPMDSDAFLWSPDSPVSRDASGAARFMGSVALAPEAGAILRATFIERPLAVLRAMLGNTVLQLAQFRVGDTLGNEHLELSARRMIRDGFAPRELAAFDAGLQMRGLLPAAAAPFLWPHLPVLVLVLVVALVGLVRGSPEQRGLVLVALCAVAANSFATGALSAPHDRYGARIIWLLPLAAMLVLPRQVAGGVVMPRRSGTGQISRMVRSRSNPAST